MAQRSRMSPTRDRNREPIHDQRTASPTGGTRRPRAGTGRTPAAAGRTAGMGRAANRKKK